MLTIGLSTMFQVNQPLQLFALHYPEFDHYWQLELDQRFMGNALEYFDALSEFARQEPRKQALERASFPYHDELFSSYEDLRDQVDIANHGHSRSWGAVRIPDVQPIGPVPPTLTPEDEDFTWGVGEEADLIVSSICAEVIDSWWTFKDWLFGPFWKKLNTPRWFCPPAIMRGSRALIHATHTGQHLRGLSVPSEATLPSWANWLGLKMSYPPQPVYMHDYNAEVSNNRPESDNDETSRFEKDWRHPTIRPFFGDPPNKSETGMSMANPMANGDKGLTHWWVSFYTGKLMDVWIRNEVDADEFPPALKVHNGQVYAPNFAMHPVKT